MDPSGVVTSTGKHSDVNRTRTALHALTPGSLSESRSRKTIRRALRGICKNFDCKTDSVFRLDVPSDTSRHSESWQEPSTVAGKEPALRLPAAVEIALFRVAQGCLSNLAKHARAGAAAIRLEIEPRHARLTITDNGSGFDAHAIPQLQQEHRWGIQIMRERLAAVGGRLYVMSTDRGTRIVAEAARKS